MRNFIFSILFFFTAAVHAQNISGVVNLYRKVLWADSATGRVKLSNVSGLIPYSGNKVMLIQMKGATINGGSSSTDPAFGDITAINGAGYYEIATICGFLSDTVVMERKLNNFYDVSQQVQCVIMPKYFNATVVDTLKAADWDPVAGTGGVVAIEVTGTLTLNKPISANGAGFRGGVHTQYGATCNFNPFFPPPTDYHMSYIPDGVKTGGNKGEGIAAYLVNKEYAQGKQANGGGGGNNHNGGGGGGANYGVGGPGGDRVTIINGQCKSNGAGRGGATINGYGYSILPATKNRIFFGGGGGAGHDNDDYGMPGGHGAGIVYISANQINGAAATASDNTIMANGLLPGRVIGYPIFGWSNASASDGSGGGGAGGAVIIKSNFYIGNTVFVEAKAANGGNSEIANNTQCSGPGGGGGGGVIWLSQPALPSGVNCSVTGGANGIATSGLATCINASNGAGSGTNGAVLFNFTEPQKDTSPVCLALIPLVFDINLNGYSTIGKNYLSLSVSATQFTQQCTLQRATVLGNFYDLINIAINNSNQYRFIDDALIGANQYWYRVKILDKTGRLHYSTILSLHASQSKNSGILSIYPNPSREKISLRISARYPTKALIAIKDDTGKILLQKEEPLALGINLIPLSLEKLPDGLLIIEIQLGFDKLVTRFMKL